MSSQRILSICSSDRAKGTRIHERVIHGPGRAHVANHFSVRALGSGKLRVACSEAVAAIRDEKVRIPPNRGSRKLHANEWEGPKDRNLRAVTVQNKHRLVYCECDLGWSTSEFARFSAFASECVTKRSLNRKDNYVRNLFVG